MTVGVPWTPPVVASIEAGTRELHLGELVLAAAALDASLGEFFAGEGRVKVATDVEVELKTFWSAIRSEKGLQDLRRQTRDEGQRQMRDMRPQEGSPDELETFLAMRGDLGEAEYRAGRQLEVSPATVALYALNMYKRSLSKERDRRVKERYGLVLTRRSRQAARGYVMRSILAELEAKIIEDREQGGRPSSCLGGSGLRALTTAMPLRTIPDRRLRTIG
jgi:hypothetical protein